MSNFITLKVEGVPSEQGHVRADEFLDELSSLLTTLNGIDRLVGESGSPALYYRIVAVSHSSPLTITLEPAFRPRVQRPRMEHLEATHSRFFTELRAIKEDRPISPEVDEQLLEHLRDLSGTAETSFKTVTISNGNESVELDKTFESNVRKLLSDEVTSYGGVEGTLDTVNIHGYARRFWIYPTLGAQRIRCDFLPGTSEQIRDALGSYVRVEGLKYFRAQSPYPYRVAVRELETLSDANPVHLKDLKGIAAGATGRLGSVEFVRAIRDEWD